VNKLKKIQEGAKAALCKAHDDIKCFADRTHTHVPDYKVGDQMWLSTKNLNINQPSRTLTEKQIGPYTITCVVSPNAVVLKFIIPPNINPMSSCSQGWRWVVCHLVVYHLVVYHLVVVLHCCWCPPIAMDALLAVRKNTEKKYIHCTWEVLPGTLLL